MSRNDIGVSDAVRAYLLEVGVREPEVLARLRQETAPMEMAGMQISPSQAAFMGMLVQLLATYIGTLVVIPDSNKKYLLIILN